MFRELVDDAPAHNMTVTEYFLELERRLGPMPKPPVGFRLDPRSDTRWLGPETLHQKWIITPVWNAATDTRTVDVWLADHTPPNYSQLSATDALDLVEALAAASRA